MAIKKFRSVTAASCPTYFAKGKASSPRGTWSRVERSKADTVLAKHDERYMPREIVDTLKKQGRWQDGAAENVLPARESAR